MGRRALFFFSALAIAAAVVIMPPKAAAQTSGSRPLLVVVMRLAGSAAESGFVGPWDHGFAVNRYFAGDGVNGYMRAASRGAFSYVPAVGDGVVDVDYPGSIEDFSSAQRTAIIALRSADSSVDFAGFDTNGNGLLDGRELAVEVVVLGGSRRGPGETRAIAGYDPTFTQLDGTGFSGDFMVATVNGFSTFMTAVHELFHQSFDASDAYDAGVGHLDIMGPTYDVADSARWMPSAALRLQLGWITPRVVDSDASFSANEPAIVAGRFLVEARGVSSWDRNASARGVVLWRISGRGYELLTPAVVERDAQLQACDSTGCRGGDPADAFSSATVPLRVGPRSQPYSAGSYAGTLLRIDGSDVIAQFGQPLPAPPVRAPRAQQSRAAISTTSSSVVTTTTTVIDNVVTAAPGLWPTVFNTEELGRLLDELCALELPGCAVYRVQEFFLYH